MTLAEEFFNIAKQAEEEKKIKQQIEERKEKQVLQDNTLNYWETYVIPLFQERIKDGLYFINFKFAQKYNGFLCSGPYFPVEPVNTVYGGLLSYKDFWDRSEWNIFKNYWKLPIDINEFITIAQNNGFYIKEQKYEEPSVYDLDVSCKPYPKTFRESLILTDQEKGYHNSGLSKGEMAIELLLIQNNVKYKNQFIFSNCRYKKELPFDFAILNDNGSIKCLIEYNGEQHFKYIPYWHKTEEGFKQQQLRDSIKTEFCKINNIELIRISYTEFNNIEKILKSYNII